MQWNNLRQEYLDSKLMETIDKDNHPAKEYERQEKYAYVRHLLERGADANLKNADGMSLLKLAAAHKMLPTVQLLLKAGADVSGFDKDSEGNHSALMNAIFDGNVPTVQKLIDGKADIHCISKNKETPLTYAATKSQFEVLKLLIDEGADIYATTQSQVFPGYVHAQTAEVILDALARNGTKDQAARYLNESHISGKPALFAAARNDEAMRMMLKSGADASIKAAKGETVLDEALRTKLVSSVTALLEHGVKVDDSTLRSVVLYGDKYTAKDLIAGNGGNSIPLILCTNPHEGKDKRYIPYESSDRIERSNTKLSNGLESVIETVMGRLLDPDTQLEKSKQLEWKNIHQESVDSSLLSSIPDESGDSLSTAIYWIEKGADVNAAIESCGTTALMLTAKSSYLKTMQRLLNEKADINAVDNLGINTLMHATLNTQSHAPKMVGMLLKNGADIYARTHSNETVIINAVKTNKISVLEKILETATSSLISDNSTSDRNGLPPTHQEKTTATTGVANILHELIPLTTDDPLKSCDEILPNDKLSSKEFYFPEPFSHRNYGHGFKHFEKLSDGDACMPGKPLGVSFGKIASSQQETARPWQAAYNSVFGVPAGKDAVLIHNAFKAQCGPNIHGMQAAHTAAVHPTTDNVWRHDTCLQIWGRYLAGHTTTAAAQPPFWGPVAAMGQGEPQAMDVLLTASVAQSTPPAQVSQAQAPGAEDEALMEAVVIGSMEWSGH